MTATNTIRVQATRKQIQQMRIRALQRGQTFPEAATKVLFEAFGIRLGNGNGASKVNGGNGKSKRRN